ncbi:MAG: molybdopterin-dependent oxidoreductase, partial [Calditrichia bacterium]|nr:molybdopterin-dependent oxidoreductase [Calditrichia bacterium]
NVKADILPLPSQNNLNGSILMGVYPEILPGGFSSANQKHITALKKKWQTEIPKISSYLDSRKMMESKKLKVLYLIGENLPEMENLPADFIIYQNIVPPADTFEANLAFPAAAFTETDGSFINGEGRIQRVNEAVRPIGEALPDWQILCKIAQNLGVKGFDYTNVWEIHKEISEFVKGFEDFDNPERNAAPLLCEAELNIPKITPLLSLKTDKKFPLLLTTTIKEHTHRGFPLSTWVEGTRKIFSEEKLEISTEDAANAGIIEEDQVVVSSTQFEKIWPVKINAQQPAGTLHITLSVSGNINPNPHSVRIKKKNV